MENQDNTLNQGTPLNQDGALNQQSTPQPEAPIQNTNFQEPEKKSKGKWVIIIAVLILLVAGAAAALIGSQRARQNQISLGEAMVNTINATLSGDISSGEMIWNAAFEVEDFSRDFGALAADQDTAMLISQMDQVLAEVNFTGAYNRLDSDKFETSGDLKFSIKNPTGGSLGILPSQEMAFSYKIFPEGMYLKVDKIPSLATMMLPPNLSLNQFLGKWYEIPSDAGFTPELPEDLEMVALPAEAETRLRNFFDDENAFTVVNRKRERVDGIAVTAIYLETNWKTVADNFIRTSRELGNPMPRKEEAELRSAFEMMDTIPVANSHFKVLVNDDGIIQGYDMKGELLDQAGSVSGRYNANLLGKNYNQEIKIEKPENPSHIFELFGLFSALFM